MLQSKLLPKTRKEAPKDEGVFKRAAAYPHRLYQTKTWWRAFIPLPLGLRVMKKIDKYHPKRNGSCRRTGLLMPALSRKKIPKNRRMGDIGLNFSGSPAIIPNWTLPSGRRTRKWFLRWSKNSICPTAIYLFICSSSTRNSGTRKEPNRGS